MTEKNQSFTPEEHGTTAANNIDPNTNVSDDSYVHGIEKTLSELGEKLHNDPEWFAGMNIGLRGDGLRLVPGRKFTHTDVADRYQSLTDGAIDTSDQLRDVCFGLLTDPKMLDMHSVTEIKRNSFLNREYGDSIEKVEFGTEEYYRTLFKAYDEIMFWCEEFDNPSAIFSFIALANDPVIAKHFLNRYYSYSRDYYIGDEYQHQVHTTKRMLKLFSQPGFKDQLDRFLVFLKPDEVLGKHRGYPGKGYVAGRNRLVRKHQVLHAIKRLADQSQIEDTY